MIDGHQFTQTALDILHPTSTLRRQGFTCSHGSFVARVIELAQLSSSNLVIAWFFLHKYSCNSMLAPESEPEEDSMTIYLLLTALILSNKLYDDQSFTLKTWISLIQRSSPPQRFSACLKTLDAMERHFLAALDYRVSYKALDNDVQFWRLVPSYVTCFDQHIPANNYASPAPVQAVAPAPQIPWPNPSYYTPLSNGPSFSDQVPLTPVTPLFAIYPGNQATPPTPFEAALFPMTKASTSVHRGARLQMPRVTKPASRAKTYKGQNHSKTLSAPVAGWTDAHIFGRPQVWIWRRTRRFQGYIPKPSRFFNLYTFNLMTIRIDGKKDTSSCEMFAH